MGRDSCWFWEEVIYSYYICLMHIPEAYYRVSVKAWIVDNSWRPLFARVAHAWDMLWWWIDHGETPQEALVREIKEEAWIDVTWVDEDPIHFVPYQTKRWFWKANIYYKTTLKNLDLIPTSECLELRYMDADEILEEPVFDQLRETCLLLMSKD